MAETRARGRVSLFGAPEFPILPELIFDYGVRHFCLHLFLTWITTDPSCPHPAFSTLETQDNKTAKDSSSFCLLFSQGGPTQQF